MAEWTKYNGWTNYPTWRISLEIFDDIDTDYWEDLLVDNPTAYELGEHFRDYTEELLDTSNDLAESYALAFIDSVNWSEIAQGTIDTYRENYCCDNCNERLEDTGVHFCSDKCKTEYNMLADHDKG